jgi:transcriptional regulator with XRE-family HTH domain
MTLIDLQRELRTRTAAAIRSGAAPSQTAIAAKIGVRQGTVSNVLRGGRRASLFTLSEIAEAAGIEISATITTQAERAA